MARNNARSFGGRQIALGLTYCLLLAAVLYSAAGCALSGKSLGESIDDAAITAKIKLKYAKDPIVSAMRINVDTFKGKVYLIGSVKSKQEEERAIKLAKETYGVTDVESKLVMLEPYVDPAREKPEEKPQTKPEETPQEKKE